MCEKCGREVQLAENAGTLNRNHCPYCLWSKDMDITPGDRKSICFGLMSPIGLTFKIEGVDKYGRPRQGELMLIHQCQKCNKISINRIAGDDDPEMILAIFSNSLALKSEDKQLVTASGIRLLEENDREEIETQLFGKS